MTKISIIGAGGMAGHMISRYLTETGKYDVQNISHSVKLGPDWILADVEDAGAITQALERFAPAVVINCVGMLVKESEQNPGKAAYINGYFPHLLEKLGANSGFKLMHLSTDCVFSGEKGGYSETDVRDGKGFYAQSKAMGEVINDRDLTIRTSIIGPELKKNATGLFHWFMTSTGTVKGFSSAYWNGVTTLELAKFVEAVLSRDISGLCHLATPEKISKFALISLIQETWERKTPVIGEDSTYISDKTLVCTRGDIPLVPKGYPLQLRELRAWMLDHKDLYAQYAE